MDNGEEEDQGFEEDQDEGEDLGEMVEVVCSGRNTKIKAG